MSTASKQNEIFAKLSNGGKPPMTQSQKETLDAKFAKWKDEQDAEVLTYSRMCAPYIQKRYQAEIAPVNPRVAGTHQRQCQGEHLAGDQQHENRPYPAQVRYVEFLQAVVFLLSVLCVAAAACHGVSGRSKGGATRALWML